MKINLSNGFHRQFKKTWVAEPFMEAEERRFSPKTGETEKQNIHINDAGNKLDAIYYTMM